MFKIMKADLYRILRGKSFYITLVVLALITILQFAAGDPGTIGVQMGPIDNQAVNGKWTGAQVPMYIMQVTDNLAYFVLPFIISIAAADFSAGSVRNILSTGISRLQLYVARLIQVCLVTVSLMLLQIILPLIIISVMYGFGQPFTMDYFMSILKPFLGQLLFMLAMSCCGVAMTFGTRKTAIINTFYILLTVIPLLLISLLVYLYPEIKGIIRLDIITSIRSMSEAASLPADEIVKLVLIGLGYIVASTGIGIVLFKKAEIK